MVTAVREERVPKARLSERKADNEASARKGERRIRVLSAQRQNFEALEQLLSKTDDTVEEYEDQRDSLLKRHDEAARFLSQQLDVYRDQIGEQRSEEIRAAYGELTVVREHKATAEAALLAATSDYDSAAQALQRLTACVADLETLRGEAESAGEAARSYLAAWRAGDVRARCEAPTVDELRQSLDDAWAAVDAAMVNDTKALEELHKREVQLEVLLSQPVEEPSELEAEGIHVEVHFVREPPDDPAENHLYGNSIDRLLDGLADTEIPRDAPQPEVGMLGGDAALSLHEDGPTISFALELLPEVVNAVSGLVAAWAVLRTRSVSVKATSDPSAEEAPATATSAGTVIDREEFAALITTTVEEVLRQRAEADS